MRSILFLLSIPLVLIACSSKQEKKEETSPGLDTDLSEFYSFYQRFHRDSLFQIDHIIFPLEGLPSETDSLTLAAGDFRWQREEWIMHRPFDFETSEFNRQILPLSETLVEEKIVHGTGQFGMIRRFAKLGGEWNLIYYAGMNRLK